MSTSPSSVATFPRKIKTVAKPRHYAQQRKSGYVSQAPPNAYKLSHFETHTNQINADHSGYLLNTAFGVHVQPAY